MLTLAPFLFSALLTSAMQQPAVQTPGQKSYEKLCLTRKLPLEPKRGPSGHFHFTGKILFQFPSGDSVQQECEVLVGGPSRLRYLLKQDGKRNLARVQSRTLAWFRPNGATQFQEWDAEELSRQTWLRWTASRFPWDFQLDIAGQKQGHELRASTPWGTMEISVGEDGLLSRLRLRTMEVKLSNWKPSSNGVLFPQKWEWITPSLTQIETFTAIDDSVLVFDKAFTPFSDTEDQDAASNWTGNPTTQKKQRIAGEEYGLQFRAKIELLVSELESTWWNALSTANKQNHWILFSEGKPLQVGISPETASRPKGLQTLSLPEGLWLRWVTYAKLPATDLADEIRQSAQRSKLQALGPVLFRGQLKGKNIGRRELLLPVKKKD